MSTKFPNGLIADLTGDVTGDVTGTLYGYVTETIQTVSGATVKPATANIAALGVSTLAGTTVNKYFLVGAPSTSKSYTKEIFITSATTKGYIYASSTGATAFDGSSGFIANYTTDSPGSFLRMKSVSGTRWDTYASSTTITFGTTEA